MICSVPLYAAMKKRYPLSKITLVASPTNYPIPFQELNPFIDEIILYDKSSFFSIVKFYRKLWKKNYQICIVPSTIRSSFTSHIISFLSFGKLRVGVKSIDGKNNDAAFLLNRKAEFNWEKEKKHQSERNLDIARLAGCELADKEKYTKVSYTDETVRKINGFVKKNFPLDKMIIGFHPGAGKKANIWKAEKFIGLIAELHKRYNNYVLLTCGPIDNELIGKITKRLDSLEIAWVTNDGLTIPELTCLLEKITLFVNTDTGIMHIAGSTNVKQISLFGESRTYEWAPRGENKYLIQKESEDINDIEEKEVLDLCVNIIGE